jgi:GAF domain-containing protein
MQNSSVEQNSLSLGWLDNQLLPIPANEKERLQALSRYESLDSGPEHEEAFDRSASLVALLCDKPIVFINLIGDDKQLHKPCFGFKDVTSPRTNGFCQYTIMQDEILEVEDTLQDDLFRNNPYVTEGLKLRYYAAVPLQTDDGYNIATLCIADQEPSSLIKEQKDA